MSVTPGPVVGSRRPLRADARRNYDALVTAARQAFADHGTDAALEDIARRAGVGIATLYRNFPTRLDLVEGVYVEEIEALCRTADEVGDREPWPALVIWFRRFVQYIGTKKALMDSLNRDSDTMRACRAALYGAAGPLLERAQQAGVARQGITVDDAMRFVMGVTGAGYVDDAQRDLVFGLAMDGLRSRRSD